MKPRTHGLLHWVFPAILAVSAIGMLISGRDFSVVGELMAGAPPPRPAAMQWIQRLVSLLLVVATVERINNYFTQGQGIPSRALALTFVGFWIGSVAAPALWSPHPRLSHEFVYSLALGIAAVLSSAADRDKVLDAARNSLFLFMLIGALLIPIKPPLVLELDYSQGLLAGIPRFAGLSVHAVSLGMLSLTAILCLWQRPFERRWLNRLAWLLGLAVLFFAQSKTAWISAMLSFTAMILVRHTANFWRRLGDPESNSFGILACLVFIIAVTSVMVVVVLGEAQAVVTAFFDSAQGAQAVSFTGRDRIWAIALEEWRASWWFGYGPSLWDDDFRASIGMPFATHAHNQYMDTLARSGTVGAATLVVYAFVLFVLSVRYAVATGGLSLGLFLALAMRSVSEVPLALFNYDTEVFTHLLLVVTLASTAASRKPAPETEAGFADPRMRLA